MDQKNKKQIFFFAVVLCFLFFMFLYFKFEDEKLRKEGHYSLGVVNSTMRTKNGIDYRCKFWYKGKEYNTKFSGLGLRFKINDLVFIRFLPSNPEENDPIIDVAVPQDLTISDVPEDGWKEISRPIRF